MTSHHITASVTSDVTSYYRASPVTSHYITASVTSDVTSYYRASPVDKVVFLEERVKERRNEDCMLVSSESGYAFFWNIYGVAQCGGELICSVHSATW